MFCPDETTHGKHSKFEDGYGQSIVFEYKKEVIKMELKQRQHPVSSRERELFAFDGVKVSKYSYPDYYHFKEKEIEEYISLIDH